MSAISEALKASNKRPSGAGRAAIPSLWRGEILESYSDGTVSALVPSLLGPEAVRIPSAVPDLAPRDRVVIGAIEGRTEDLVVIIRG